MRITVNIDDELLRIARAIARQQQKTTGEVLSELVRKAIADEYMDGSCDSNANCHGFHPFPARVGVVTDKLIETLRLQECV